MRGQLAEPALQVIKRNINRTGQVAGGKLLRGPHVEHGDAGFAHALEQLVARDRFHVVAAAQRLQFAALVLRVYVQRGQQLHDGAAAEPVQHALAVAPRLHETGAPQLLQMLGGIGHGQARQLHQLLHRIFAMRDLLEQAQTRRAA
ncbi:hypothetical protein D3C81_1507260 [compost metagenome]